MASTKVEQKDMTKVVKMVDGRVEQLAYMTKERKENLLERLLVR